MLAFCTDTSNGIHDNLSQIDEELKMGVRLEYVALWNKKPGDSYFPLMFGVCLVSILPKYPFVSKFYTGLTSAFNIYCNFM